MLYVSALRYSANVNTIISPARRASTCSHQWFTPQLECDLAVHAHFGGVVVCRHCLSRIRVRFAGWSTTSACKTNTTQNQPHQISNTQRTENNTTDVVIQQHSRRLLKMDILMPETCWAHKNWNKIASDIKLIFHSSSIWFCFFPYLLYRRIYESKFPTQVSFHFSILYLSYQFNDSSSPQNLPFIRD